MSLLALLTHLKTAVKITQIFKWLVVKESCIMHLWHRNSTNCHCNQYSGGMIPLRTPERCLSSSFFGGILGLIELGIPSKTITSKKKKTQERINIIIMKWYKCISYKPYRHVLFTNKYIRIYTCVSYVSSTLWIKKNQRPLQDKCPLAVTESKDPGVEGICSLPYWPFEAVKSM